MTPTDGSDGSDRVGGRYELVRQIARGGGGTVHEGYDHALQRVVAVKSVAVPGELPPVEQRRLRARVNAEARAAARLEHPGAVAIFDVIDAGEVMHLVLELVDLPTLEEQLDRDGAMGEADVARLGLELLDVLDAAHERGIVHRDVKPSNVFVTPDGSVKLTDFGIAILKDESSLTRTGVAMGSPQFVSPEQAVGERATAAADLWALGVTLYLAVEGVPPFERPNPLATVHAVVNDEPRPTQRAERLRDVLATMLVKEPSDRADAGAVRTALLAVAEADGTPARRDVRPQMGSAADAAATGEAGEGRSNVDDVDAVVDLRLDGIGEAVDLPVATGGGRAVSPGWLLAAVVVIGLVVLLAVTVLGGGGG